MKSINFIFFFLSFFFFLGNIHVAFSLIMFLLKYYNTADIPLDLLKHCPGLASTLDPFNDSPVHALSCCSKSVFPSICQLGFWQRWVYDCVYISTFFVFLFLFFFHFNFFSIIHSLASVSLLTGIDVAACAANQVTIDVENQECTHGDKNDLTEIRSGKQSTNTR